MDHRLVFRSLASLLLILLLWLGWWLFGRSAESQIRSAQSALQTAVENRDWDDVADFLSPDYTDSYSHTRESAIQDGRKYLGAFFVLSIKTEQTTIRAATKQGMVQTQIRLEGTGAGYSQAVLGAVNQIQEPWVFHWTKTGLWPWTWQVTMIHNDQIR